MPSKKFVIYTALVGNYDTICQPKVIAEDFDYVLFTNDIPEQRLGVWQVKGIPYHHKNNTKVARWVKTHPHLLLQEYEVSLWHDANVHVDQQDYFIRIRELIDKGVLIASMDHVIRHCIYEEGFTVLYSNLDKVGKVMREMAHLKHDGYPVNNGLTETNCMLRRHQESRVNQFCDGWWAMIDKYSLRDQLSCDYVARKYRLKIEHILPEGLNARKHFSIHCEGHQSHNDINRMIWVNPLGARFKVQSKKFYDSFISSENYSFKEFFSLLTIVIIRYYFSLVTVKYRICTRLKRSFK